MSTSSCAVDHLFKHYQWYKNDTLEAASTFLSACMNSETYGTDKVGISVSLVSQVSD